MHSTISNEQLTFRHAPSLPTALASSVLGGPFEGEAEVRGVVPAWLRGRLIRTAPAIFEFDNWQAQHWFDALGMLYSFDIGANGRVHWMQRLLECEFNRSVLHGRDELASFGTRNHRGLFQRLLHPMPRSTDNANVNIRPEGRHWIAMSETERQLSIVPDSLKTAAEVRFADALPKRLLISAHPHDDSERKELINIGVLFGARSRLIVFSQPYGSTARREIGRVPLRRVPYVHSFAITRTKIVLILAPYDLKPASLLWSKRPDLGTLPMVTRERDTDRCHGQGAMERAPNIRGRPSFSFTRSMRSTSTMVRFASSCWPMQMRASSVKAC